jgi:hypothetical protein
MFDESAWLSPLSMIFKFLCILHKKKAGVRAENRFFRAARAAQRTGRQRGLPGFFLLMPYY